MKHCKDCGNTVKDLYCSHCGQKTKVDRITYAYLWKEIFHFFTHIDHSFFYTSWQMVVAPRKTITGFLAGKRKTYQSPVSYFLIWTTIYILALYAIDLFFGENVVINYRNYFGPHATTKFAISHLSLVLTIVIPFQALYLLLLVAKKNYNYFETLVAATYIMGTIILLQFVFAVLALLFYLTGSGSVDLRISDIFKGAYLTWFIFNFIKAFKVSVKFLRAITFVILAFGTFTVWRLYGVPELVNWFLSNH